MKKTFGQHVAMIGGGLVLSAAAQAGQSPSLYLAPFVGYQTFDNELSLEDDMAVGLALGRQLDNNWAVELAYSQTETEIDGVLKSDVDNDYWHFDALYQFPGESKWTPYLVFGVGETIYKYDNEKNDETQWNAGAGVQYAVTSRLSLRADVRGLMVAEEVSEGAVANLGVVLALGNVNSKPAVKPVPQAPVEVAPVAEVVPEPVVEKDTDGDGVFDSKDKCPDTSKGAKVDADGCYLALEEDREFTLNVRFQTAKAVIQQDSKGQIAELAAFLTQYPQTSTVVEGHTDSDGSAEYNKTLSQKRAEAVRQSLIDDYKVAAERVTAVGYGEEKPIADNATAEGKAQNRRVVAKVSTKK